MLRALPVLLLVACNGGPQKADTFEQGRRAAAKGDYTKAYWLMIPLAQEANPEAAMGLSVLTDPNASYLSASQAVQMGVLHRAGWLRRAAYGSWPAALDELSAAYASWEPGFAKDRELASCFRNARTHKIPVKQCQELELRKGYIRNMEPASVCLACERESAPRE